MDLAVLRRWWPLAAVLVLLFGTALAATRSQPQLDQIKTDATTPPPPPLLPTAAPSVSRAGAQAQAPPSGLPDWVSTVALVLLGLVGLIVLGVVVTALIRDQARRRARRVGRLAKRGGDQPRTADELVAALDA